MAHIEIELEDVLEFMKFDATDDELDNIASALDLEMIKDLEDEIKNLGNQIDDSENEVRELENKLDDAEDWEIKTLYDEMKLKLLKSAMNTYSLEELEHRLGKEFDLSAGRKKYPSFN